MEVKIRELQPEDWAEVARIYKEGIDTGNATFEQQVPEWKNWNKSHLKKCRLIAEADNEVAGWAALTPVSGRCVYAGVAEVSVYISKKYQGKKIASALLKELIQRSEKENLWTLQAGIFPENIASIKIHKNLGFREVGYREKIGKMNGVWRDTLLFERRSKYLFE